MNMCRCATLIAYLYVSELLLLTVATDTTDGFSRYLRSAEVNGLQGKVIGMGEEWLGGDMAYPGGGHKINLLKKEIEALTEDNDNLVLMFTDAYDVLVLADEQTILSRFKELDARVVFSAEPYCWPDTGLADAYPEVEEGNKRYLNSGGFIGYAKDIVGILQVREVKDTDDDQLYYTRVFLDPELRAKFNIKLDTKSFIFQNLNGATGIYQSLMQLLAYILGQ